MAKWSRYSWKAGVVTIGTLAGTSLVGGRLWSEAAATWENMPSPTALFVPALIGTVLTVVALAFPVLRSTLRGWRLFGAVFALVVGLNVVLINIEAAVFLTMPTEQVVRGVLVGMVRAALLALLMALTFGREPRPERQTPAKGPVLTSRSWLSRIGLSSVCYFVLYFVAGMTIYPFVKPFYDTQDMSIGAGIVPLQLVRGALYLAFALPLLRTVVATRRQLRYFAAVLFPLLAGVADLLAPNPIMPDWIRPFHIVEIGWSNFAYGWLVAHLFWNPRAGVQATASRIARETDKTFVSPGRGEDLLSPASGEGGSAAARL
jgi:hypothetical protein